MLGTFGGALEARKIDAANSRLTCSVRGEVEEENRVLILRRVHVSFHLRADEPEKVRETVERVHGVFANQCPVYRSLRPAFAITSTVDIIH
jgi:uncharacterized OsmC-like protein